MPEGTKTFSSEHYKLIKILWLSIMSNLLLSSCSFAMALSCPSSSSCSSIGRDGSTSLSWISCSVCLSISTIFFLVGSPASWLIVLLHVLSGRTPTDSALNCLKATSICAGTRFGDSSRHNASQVCSIFTSLVDHGTEYAFRVTE